jgi:hypothetical protein
MNLKRKNGQSIVEIAIMLPLLLTVLVGIGYFGNIVTIQHNLTIASRYVARNIAIESTSNPVDRTEGTYIVSLTKEKILEKAYKALPNFDKKRINVEPIPAEIILMLSKSVSEGKFEIIPEGKGFVFIYKRQGRISNSYKSIKNEIISQLSNLNVGIGNLFFGVKLTYKLDELDWMAKFLFRKKEGITLQSISLMPAELPLRSFLSGKYGLMELNKDIFDIISVNVRSTNKTYLRTYQYEDLVDTSN